MRNGLTVLPEVDVVGKNLQAFVALLSESAADIDSFQLFVATSRRDAVQ